MASLGLNEHHQSAVVNYLRFSRYQRGLRLKSVDGCFKDLKQSRLTEDTYTVDEVNEMLDGLLGVVRGEVDTELGHTGHTNVLLLMQLFQQAEKWHLKLQADISELENRELLEKIKNFEESEFGGSRRGDSDVRHAPRLEPMNESGGAVLLNMEIDRINSENDRLKERLKQVESQALVVTKEKTQLQAQLDKANVQIASFQGRKPADTGAEVDELRNKLTGLKTSMDQNTSMSRAQAEKMENDLAGTKHELLKIREMLDMAEKELERKVSQTAPFQNLKLMLTKKNDQLKDLRKRLSKYEEVAAD